ncbi:capsid cement protein [Candidatus Tokpelaia sp.]|uniref:capsid cement protein n=1 Tax=Candidatus Tokpelaia sp. TaxID=2233777 RepID=UPI00123C2390|nr:capsid cement protein [Candidatus Tokpelaia sp.]KAA6404485.1 hypothetical protein DPQ22_09645 [Candidatus Tokpelaia sp.]
MAEQENYFRGAIETLAYTIIPKEQIKAGQAVGFDGRIAKAGQAVQGVAAHDTDEFDLERGLKIVAIGQVDLMAGSAIKQGDALTPDDDGLPKSGGNGFGIALSNADKGGLVKVLLRGSL